MSPTHSDYRSFEFDYELEELMDDRAEFQTGRNRPAGRVSNTPSRSSSRSRKSKSGSSFNGIQRRRNKHWTW